MPCYRPITAYRGASGITFRDTTDAIEIKLPCGQCIHCRLQYSYNWAVRLVHELRFHESSCFLTLTYSEEHLPPLGSLCKKDFQDFMKRLRRSLDGKKVRFYHCGEYGEKFGRPHYHAIIYGHSFDDRYQEETSKRGDLTWSSRQLDELWPFGISRIGAVTYESAAYVARYCMKKVNGKQKEAHYERINDKTGEVYSLQPEYATMSRKPGIAKDHYDRYADEIYLDDAVVISGVSRKPPRYYDKLLEKDKPGMYGFIKEQRQCAMELSPKIDSTPDRLAVREAVKQAQMGTLVRRYEIG